jgi:DNA-binding NarL/FixJ family response regulator
MTMAGITFRVLVADDYEPWCRLVSSVVQKQPQLHLVGEAADGVEAVRKAQERKADIILLDVNLPKLNGFKVAQRILEHLPQAKIILVSADRSFDIAAEALRMGAYGYLVKSDAGRELVRALATVLEGNHYISSSVVGRVSRTLMQAPSESCALPREAHERG